MTKGYTKLFSTIITSTIWREDSDTCKVWITLLALADKNGEVQASLPGLADMARVPIPVAEAAIKKFLSPDVYSRTKDNDGRRMAEIDGGWELLNYTKYRAMTNKEDQKAQAAERARRYRERHAPSRSVTKSHDIAEAEAEAEADTKETTDIAQTKKSEQPKYDKDLMGFSGITDDDRKEWAEAYPACDIAAELRRMVQWCKANPKKAHKSNWRKFIVNWLSRSQDHGGEKNAKNGKPEGCPFDDEENIALYSLMFGKKR